MKTILLVNGSTASASEILTGALHDYGKATIIGEKTYGKGCVQALENFMDGSVLRVTIAKWYTPHGNNIHEEGIEPDKVVERTFEQINKDVDPQLDAALAY
jgi:carboxyl-terminal processing protease